MFYLEKMEYTGEDVVVLKVIWLHSETSIHFSGNYLSSFVRNHSHSSVSGKFQAIRGTERCAVIHGYNNHLLNTSARSAEWQALS